MIFLKILKTHCKNGFKKCKYMQWIVLQSIAFKVFYTTKRKTEFHLYIDFTSKFGTKKSILFFFLHTMLRGTILKSLKLLASSSTYCGVKIDIEAIPTIMINLKNGFS